MAVTEEAKDEATSKATEDAKAAKEAHEKAIAEAVEELGHIQEEVERKAAVKLRPDFLGKLSRKWSSKGRSSV